jgi:hypothetical protein
MRRSVAMILLVVAVACTPDPPEQEQASGRLEAARQESLAAYQEGDYATFRDRLLDLVELDPENYRHRYNLACAHALTGDQEQAIEIIRFLLDEDYDLALLAKDDSDFDRFRDNAEWQELQARMEELATPLNRSQAAFSIPEKDLIPEGMAYDPVERAFYVGSLHKRKIIKIDRDGSISDFTGEMQDGLVRVLGMKIDSKRRQLWAVSSYLFPVAHIPEEVFGTSGVYRFDLQTGRLLGKYMLPKGEGHYLNDLTISPGGDVYVTDWRRFGIYTIAAGSDSIVRLLKMERSPNGIDISDDGTKLFIAGDGMGVYDIATGVFRELRHPPGMYVSGDGSYYYKNSIVAVQNFKISRLYLNEEQTEIIRSEPLEAFHPLFNQPTTGAIAGDRFYYIANSQARSYDAEGRLPPPEELDETQILWLELD